MMETILLEILEEIRRTQGSGESEDPKAQKPDEPGDRKTQRLGGPGEKKLAKILHKHNRNIGASKRHYTKKKLLPYYLRIKETEPERWITWKIDEDTEKKLIKLLRMKPRRTASGVATITLITKPWKCSSDCLYCPNDLRMPKSYLSSEPACQRAERNFFDPYLQVRSRLRALTQMGHITDKIELIILGGTWSDYPQAYQIWFITEAFRALNDGTQAEKNVEKRRAFYQNEGLSNREDELAELVAEKQQAIHAGLLSYNRAVAQLYGKDSSWQKIARRQVADFDELDRQQSINETAARRVVGLVVETRPDTIDCESLMLLRRLGCTKVQIGIQSLDPVILRKNNRHGNPTRVVEAFELLRLFGFKIHAHFMVNLYGSTPGKDKKDYLRFITEKAYLPDEVKLYPCSLVAGTGLGTHHADGSWQPYSEEELLDILIADTLATPPFVRISRMIRDISARDILAGNKKANLRQMVEGKIARDGEQVEEIRYREISTSEVSPEELRLEILPYESSVSDEFFLQWVTPENKIAGFLRLSLPEHDFLLKLSPEQRKLLPVKPGEAMIREVHVYGRVASLSESGGNAQHLGLGKRLIETACTLAKTRSYHTVKVISSVGTREYYRNLGFTDQELYQELSL